MTRAPHVVVQTHLIGMRSVRKTLRMPASLVPPIVFPLLLLAINSAGLADAPKLPGFPAESYLDFALVVTFMQGSLFATTTAGLFLGQDIESGFLNRLALTPMHGAALVLGKLAGAVTVGAMSSFLYIAVGLAFGVHFAAGIFGIAALWLLACCTALTFAAIGAYMALRAGSGEAVQGLFPVLFATLFLSTMTMPFELLDAAWFEAIARANPVSYMINGMRSLIIEGWDFRELAIGLSVMLAVLAVALFGCSRELRRRLTRT